MKKSVSKYYILLLLALMFAAPGITAYVFYQHPNWLTASRINKGTLLNPPVSLNSLDKKTKWRIAFWSPGTCAEACLKQLDMLARIRLALGRKLYQVDQWLLLGEQVTSLPDAIKSGLQQQDFHMTQVSSDDETKLKTLSAEGAIFIINPDNYLILSYSSQVNPDDIFKDLKLLLNTTETKSG